VPRLLLLLLACSAVAARAGDVRFQLTDAKGAPVADAVVSLTPLDSTAPVAVANKPSEIEQRAKEFQPYVTAIQVGTTVRFPNRDEVEHHVYSLSKAKKFEFPLYKPGMAEEIVFDQAGVVAVGCNIHDWMAAYVIVLPTPWFAVTPATGDATVSLPPGRYQVEIWQPRLKEKITREIVVSDRGPTEPLAFQLALKPDQRRRAPAAGSSGYK
jgi:plastocyanin